MSDDERYAEYFEGRTLDDAPDDTPDDTSDDTLDENARAELDELLRIFATSSTWEVPEPQLADDVVAGIRAAAPAVQATPAAQVTPMPRRRDWTAPLLALAAAVVLAVALGAVFFASQDDGGESFALAATDVIPGADGSATVRETGSGLSISLSVEGLPPADPGTFYQAWMRGDAGSVPIGTFHARDGSGSIELWSGVEVADYPTMTVTIQQEGAGPESSGIVVLRGDIPQP